MKSLNIYSPSMRRLLCALMFFSVSLVAFTQTSNEYFLSGKWVVYKTTDQNNDSLTLLGTLRQNSTDTVEFLPEGKLNVYWCPLPGEPPEQSAYYFTNDSILHMGNRMYILKRIDENRMLLDDYDPSIPQIKSLLKREYLIRLERQFGSTH